MASIETINHFVPLIQFIGAFNFAYALTGFEEKIKESILNTDSRFDQRFKDFEDKLRIDRESLNNIKPLTTTDGRTTKSRNDQLSNDYDSLLRKKDEKRSRLKENIDKRNCLKAVPAMFLSIGIYTVLNLFMIGMCDHSHHALYWCNTFCVFNVLIFIYSLYFIISEFIHYRRYPYKIPRFFSPTRLWSIFIIFASFILSMILAHLNDAFLSVTRFSGFDLGSVYHINGFFTVGLPFMAFLICFSFLGIYYCISTRHLNKEIDSLIEEFNKLHVRKEDLQKVNEHFDFATENIADSFSADNFSEKPVESAES